MREIDRQYVEKNMDTVVTIFGKDFCPDNADIFKVTIFDPYSSTYHRGWSFVADPDVANSFFERGKEIALGRAFAAYKRFMCSDDYSTSPIVRPEVFSLMSEFLSRPSPMFKSQALVEPTEDEVDAFKLLRLRRLRRNVTNNLDALKHKVLQNVAAGRDPFDLPPLCDEASAAPAPVTTQVITEVSSLDIEVTESSGAVDICRDGVVRQTIAVFPGDTIKLR